MNGKDLIEVDAPAGVVGDRVGIDGVLHAIIAIDAC